MLSSRDGSSLLVMCRERESLPPLWVWVSRRPSSRAIAQVQEIRIRDPLQPPARGSAQPGSRAPPSFGLGAETCRSLRLAAGDRFFLSWFSTPAETGDVRGARRLSAEHWYSLACCPGGLATAVCPIHWAVNRSCRAGQALDPSVAPGLRPAQVSWHLISQWSIRWLSLQH